MINDNILDVLNYMFDFLFETSDNDKEVLSDKELKNRLNQAGFEKEKVDKAIKWLEDVAYIQNGEVQSFQSRGGMRIYSAQEQQKLGKKIIGILMFLEKVNQLNSFEREAIIEQIMQLEQNNISMEDFNWVVMMVLGESEHAQWFEGFIFDKTQGQTLQ
ncbi:Protein of unknown function Smg [hydrothermal vent metagenome]|uniref:Protein Smg homolog n=1 Tax=hydrothermal vent metagenome TaxID=652676 RepID=A0A1W1C9P8_9ZZZZ